MRDRDITQITSPAVILKLFNEIINNQQIELIDQFCAREFIFHSGLNTLHDLHMIRQAVSDWIKAFPDNQHQINDIICQDERVVVHWCGYIYHRDKFIHSPLWGEAFHYSGVVIFQVNHGQFTEAWMYSNLAEKLTALRANNLAYKGKASRHKPPCEKNPQNVATNILMQAISS